MKRTQADIFRINSPYGIIIRLADLRYSWYNRIYQEVYNGLKDEPLDTRYKFESKLKDQSVIEKVNDFVDSNSMFGVSLAPENVQGKPCLRVWLYNDKNFPYSSKGEIKSKMNRYEKLLLELERIIFDESR